jgi:hypothetical protein
MKIEAKEAKIMANGNSQPAAAEINGEVAARRSASQQLNGVAKSAWRQSVGEEAERRSENMAKKTGGGQLEIEKMA